MLLELNVATKPGNQQSMGQLLAFFLLQNSKISARQSVSNHFGPDLTHVGRKKSKGSISKTLSGSKCGLLCSTEYHDASGCEGRKGWGRWGRGRLSRFPIPISCCERANSSSPTGWCEFLPKPPCRDIWQEPRL